MNEPVPNEVHVRWPMLAITHATAKQIAAAYEAKVGGSATVWICGRDVLLTEAKAKDERERKEGGTDAQ